MIELLYEEYLEEMASVCNSEKYGIMIAVNPDSHRLGMPYFKFFNASSFTKATKVIRILFKEPNYVYHTDGKDLWKINAKDKKVLINILREESEDFSGYTNWQIAKYLWNREYLQRGLNMEKYFNGEYDEMYKDKPSFIPHDLEMPDYKKINI